MIADVFIKNSRHEHINEFIILAKVAAFESVSFMIVVFYLHMFLRAMDQEDKDFYFTKNDVIVKL